MRQHQIAHYGWVRDLPDARDYLFAPTAPVPIKESVDLESAFPPVVDQQTLGSCTANAIAGVLDAQRHAQGLPFMSPSRLFIYYFERLAEGTVNSDSGAQIRDGIRVCAIDGVAPESEWPYIISKFKRKPSAKAIRDAVKHEALVYRRVPQTKEAMQQALSAGLGIVGGISVYQSFENPGVVQSGIVPMPQKGESLLGGHAICFVGYGTSEFGDTVKFRNSWGTSYGRNGYGCLPWDYLLSPHLASDFWVVSQMSG